MVDFPYDGSYPMGLAIARGRIAGYERANRFGTNPAVGTTEASIWANGVSAAPGNLLYNWIPAATQLKISSSSASDDVGSTGATSVHLYGLDGNYAEIDEVIALDGKTQVTTVNTYIRVFRFNVTAAGSGGTNAGDIYVYTGTATAGVPNTTTTIYARLTAGFAATRLASYTIPAGKTGYLVNAYANAASGKSVSARLYIREFGEVFRLLVPVELNNNSVSRDYDMPEALPAKTDLDFRAVVDSTTARVNAGFTIVLIDN